MTRNNGEAMSIDRYGVIGNPIAHSRSPQIHTRFAEQTAQSMSYERLLAPVGEFVAAVEAFRAAGGRGLNVTLPFKLDAFGHATRRSARAAAAGAVNTLRFDDDGVYGDNTDGVGLVNDLCGRLGLELSGRRVLLLGAGGAARGVILPLLDAGVSQIVVCNRTVSKAHELVAMFDTGRLSAVDFAGLEQVAGGPAGLGQTAPRQAAFEVIINATSAELSQARLAIPASLLAGAKLAYDMVYSSRPTAFMTLATAAGCPRASDGLGMLVEQAAESFFVWRGVRPKTDAVLQALRQALDSEARV